MQSIFGEAPSEILMKRNALVVLLSLLAGLFASSTPSFAQINIGALAQFKQNQQAALAKQLQGASSAGKPAKAGKHGKSKTADAPMVVARPALIKAQTRSFKGNYSDMRKSNMR